jgi:uncharacterized protein DUF4389
MVMATAGAYPVRVDASLDAPLSRWLWLVKWVLVIPHYVVLAFLWLAFAVLSVVAFFAILFTGRYPRGIFGFNVGVLRWTWRVQYYAIHGFGTDHYPPFTLAEDPSYPAHLEIEYPQHLSRGLVLVKWWLLAIPHYIVVGLFTGSGVWFAWQFGRTEANWGGFGLIGLLALIAAVILMVTGDYPRQIFDFVLGMNRWVLRVAAYAGLMTDKYPPFRLDMGGHDPGSVLAVPPAPPPPPAPAGASPSGMTSFGVAPGATIPWQPEHPTPAGPPPGQGPAAAGPSGPPPGQGPAAAGPSGWTAGRVVAVVIGALLVLCSIGLLGGGAGATWATTAHRHGGYVDLGTQTYRTTGHALASPQIELYTNSAGLDVAQSLFGKVRLNVTATDGTPVFAGIARSAAAGSYLSGVAYATVTGMNAGHPSYTGHPGGPPVVPPSRAGIWAVRAAGPGTQTLIWPVASGHWTVIAMNASGSAPVSVRVNAAATLPALPWIATGLLIGGVLFLAAGVLLIAFPARAASRQRSAPASG